MALNIQLKKHAPAATGTPVTTGHPAPVVQPPVIPIPTEPDVVEPDIVNPEDHDRTLTAPGHFRAAPAEGDWNVAKHAIVPRLQIVQGNGALSREHPSGTLLLAGEVLIPAPSVLKAETVVRFVPIQHRLQWRERLDPAQYAAGLKPRIAYSREEVRAYGGTTEWVNGQRPSWEETTRTVLLLELPNTLEHTAFDAVPGLSGKYALCVYFSAGVSFKYFGQVLYSASITTLRVPVEGSTERVSYLPKRWWKAKVDARQFGKQAPWTLVPTQTTEDTSEAVRAYCNGFLNAVVDDE
jgi:hypothetical protein